MSDVIDDAIKRYEREMFWQGVNEDLARLQSDPTAWAAYQQEIALFAGGAMDGLDHEPPYYSPKEEEQIRATAARS